METDRESGKKTGKRGSGKEERARERKKRGRGEEEEEEEKEVEVEFQVEIGVRNKSAAAASDEARGREAGRFIHKTPTVSPSPLLPHLRGMGTVQARYPHHLTRLRAPTTLPAAESGPTVPAYHSSLREGPPTDSGVEKLCRPASTSFLIRLLQRSVDQTKESECQADDFRIFLYSSLSFSPPFSFSVFLLYVLQLSPFFLLSTCFFSFSFFFSFFFGWLVVFSMNFFHFWIQICLES